MIWYFQNLERFRQEREALEALAGEAPWLQIIKWRVDNEFRLIIEADIQHGKVTWPVSLRFPNHFPFSPPVVLPRGDSTRWSSHQYGAGGELCLEFGPDNWEQSITGRMMLESAHRLLAGEQPSDDGTEGEVATRHALSVGQTLRGSIRRYVLTWAAQEFLDLLPEGASITGEGNLIFHDEAVIYSAISWGANAGWIDPSYPGPLRFEGFNRPSHFIRLPSDAEWPRSGTPEELRADLRANINVDLSDDSLVLLRRKSVYRAYALRTDKVGQIEIVRAQAPGGRLDADHESLAGRKVAIVGCGSLGSKVAVSLARSGVGKFLLVDDDVMLPENLVRHELDWREVGTHKSSSVGRRIHLVNPAAEVVARQHRLGGQEAGGGIEALIKSLSEADLIVDASATPEVFNYLCAASAIGKKPMIWAEVYGGGIGGLIVRHRPSVEPEPALMRRVIENWCAEQGLPIERDDRGYEMEGAAAPMVADDADVSVIAAHAARFAVDVLIPRNPSIFPHAAYFVGLAPGWLFSQPFETHPVPMPPPSQEMASAKLDETEASEERNRIVKLFEELGDGTTAT